METIKITKTGVGINDPFERVIFDIARSSGNATEAYSIENVNRGN